MTGVIYMPLWLLLCAIAGAYLIGVLINIFVRDELKVVFSSKSTKKTGVGLKDGDTLQLTSKGNPLPFAEAHLSDGVLYMHFMSNTEEDKFPSSSLNLDSTAISKLGKAMDAEFEKEGLHDRYKKTQAKRRGYYKYQTYNSYDPLSDRLGYVHLRDKVAYDYYVKRHKMLQKRLERLKSREHTFKSKESFVEACRGLHELMAKIPHSYGRKEYKGTRKW